MLISRPQPPHNPGIQAVILPGSPGMRSIHPHKWHGGCGRENGVDIPKLHSTSKNTELRAKGISVF